MISIRTRMRKLMIVMMRANKRRRQMSQLRTISRRRNISKWGKFGKISIMEEGRNWLNRKKWRSQFQEKMN